MNNQSKHDFYEISNLMKKRPKNCEAFYALVFGMRGNGKTYSALKYALEKWKKDGSEFAYIRRFDEDFKQKRGDLLFNNLAVNGEINKITGYDSITYKSRRWFLSDIADDAVFVEPSPIGYAFSLYSMEHDKGGSLPNVRTIIFDEFITNGSYLYNEFVTFMLCVSTIIRNRTDVEIILLGNSIDVSCPYFREMGLTNVKNMKPGDIDLYSYGDSRLCVALEYASQSKSASKNKAFFAFDNPKLKMITGGDWMIAEYPHLPQSYKPKDVIYRYWIQFGDDLFTSEIVSNSTMTFQFIHPKTTELKKEEGDLIFTDQKIESQTMFHHFRNCPLKIGKKIIELFRSDKTFYSDNLTGEKIRKFIQRRDEI